MKRAIAIVIALLVIFQLCACGNGHSRERDLLCYGMWVMQEDVLDFANNPEGYIYTSVFDFKEDGTVTELQYWYAWILPDKSEKTGKYKIDTNKKQIVVKWEGNAEKSYYSYFVDEATGTMIFFDRAWKNRSSLDGLNYIW